MRHSGVPGLRPPAGLILCSAGLTNFTGPDPRSHCQGGVSPSDHNAAAIRPLIAPQRDQLPLFILFIFLLHICVFPLKIPLYSHLPCFSFYLNFTIPLVWFHFKLCRHTEFCLLHTSRGSMGSIVSNIIYNVCWTVVYFSCAGETPKNTLFFSIIPRRNCLSRGGEISLAVLNALWPPRAWHHKYIFRTAPAAKSAAKN